MAEKGSDPSIYEGETLTVEFAFNAVVAEAVDLNGHAAKIKIDTV